jgi:DNA-binding response OmpR family regulator
MKVLLVEDEKSLSESISEYLKGEGYICERVYNFENAGMKSSLYNYDLAIVDITLPDGSGLDIIKRLKEKSPQTGIIIISAKNSLDDKLRGLELGADDYITKPFYLSELNARLKSLSRRIKFQGDKEFAFGEIRILPDERRVLVEGSETELTRKEYDLLMYFISNAGKVLTKEAIAEHLWGDDIDSSDSFDFVYTHIKNLRKKISGKSKIEYIKSVYGYGYKFIKP